jgi:hypothetical protein
MDGVMFNDLRHAARMLVKNRTFSMPPRRATRIDPMLTLRAE